MMPQIKRSKRADGRPIQPTLIAFLGKTIAGHSEFNQAIFSILMAHALYSGVLA